MDTVDRRRLTKDEWNTYQKLASTRHTTAEEETFVTWVVIGAICAYIVTAGTVAWYIVVPLVGPKPDASTVWPWIIAAALGLAGTELLTWYAWWKPRVRKRAAAYLATTNYATRGTRTTTPHHHTDDDTDDDDPRILYTDRRVTHDTDDDDIDDGPHYWGTGNYDPERYYAATSGWSHEYTDYVRDNYGDLDTYESNKPD